MPSLFSRRFSTLSKLFLKKPTKISYAAAIPKPIAEHNPPGKILSYSAAIRVLKSEPNPDKILPIFYSISGDSNIPVARRFRELAVNRLAMENNFSAIEAIVEKQMECCKTADEKFFVDTIISYGKVGMVDHAIRTFNRVQELLGIPPSVLSFNALLTACNTAKKFDQVPKLFHKIPKNFRIYPDKISYGIYVRSLCELGLVESAHLVLNEMEKNDIEVTDISYSTILNGCYKNNMLELAEKIWFEMGEKGSFPGLGSYNAKILYHATNGNVEEVSRLMDEMVSVGVKPDACTYRLLMACYYNNDMIEEAQKVYDDMEANGLAPAADSFNYMVHFLCKKGKHALGLFVWKQCIQRNKKLKISSLMCLIEGLTKDLKVQQSKGSVPDAKELLINAKKKYPSYLLSEFNKLEMMFNIGGVEGSVTEEKKEMGVGAEDAELSDDEGKPETRCGM